MQTATFRPPASMPTTAWLFPGQGAQVTGMGRDLLLHYAPARELLAYACELTATDLGRIIAHGPDALLTRTDNLQPALTVILLGCCMMLQDAGFRPQAAAGHSLGEFAALYAAGVLDAHAVLRLVVARARLMQAAAATLDGAMLAVKGLATGEVAAILAAASGQQAVVLANDNTPTQSVLSGPRAALTAVSAALTAAGGTCVALNVSGPWHSPALGEAAARFAEILRQAPFADAVVPVVLNVSGAASTDGALIQALMQSQLCSPVRWTQVQRTLHGLGVTRLVELGPGRTLRGLSRGVAELAGCDVINVDGPKSLHFLGAAA